MGKSLLDFTEVIEHDYSLESNQNVDAEINGIKFALEELTNLISMKRIVMTSDNISLETSKILNIYLKGIKKTLNVNYDNLSIEGLSENNLCLETINEFIMRIWESIVNTFKYIWDKITYLFVGKKANNKIKEIEIKKMEKRINEIVKNKSTNTKTAVPLPYIETHSVTEPFDYINKEYSPSELIKNARNLENIFKDLKECIFAIEGSFNNLHDTFKALADANIDFAAFKEIIDNAKENEVSIKRPLENINLYIEGLHRDNDFNEFRKIINEHIPEDKETAEHATMKVIKGFCYNGFILFYILESDEIDPRYKMKLVKRASDDTDSVKLKMLDIHNLEVLTKIISNTKGYDIQLTDEYSNKLAGIKNRSEQLLHKLKNTFIKASDAPNINEVKASLKYVEETFNYISNLAYLSSIATEMYTSTVNHHVKLVEHMLHYWENDAKE